MSSLRGIKLVAAAALLAVTASLAVSPALASSKRGSDDQDCTEAQRRLTVTRALSSDRLHEQMACLLYTSPSPRD